MNFKKKDLLNAKTRDDLITIAKKRGIPVEKTLRKLEYEAELAILQSELVNLQKWIVDQKMRVMIIFEGRDIVGKGAPSKKSRNISTPATFGRLLWVSQRMMRANNGFFNVTSINYPNPVKWYSLIGAGITGLW